MLIDKVDKLEVGQSVLANKFDKINKRLKSVEGHIIEVKHKLLSII